MHVVSHLPRTLHPHSHLAQVRALSALSLHHHVIHVSVVSLTRPTPLSTSSFPPVCLPLPLLPPQRRAAAGAQQEDHGKPVRLRQQRG